MGPESEIFQRRLLPERTGGREISSTCSRVEEVGGGGWRGVGGELSKSNRSKAGDVRTLLPVINDGQPIHFSFESHSHAHAHNRT